MTQSEQQIKAGVDLGRVRAALAPVFDAHGVRLVDLEWLTERTGWTLRITIEREGGSTTNLAGGVTLEDCSDVSKDASAVLDSPKQRRSFLTAITSKSAPRARQAAAHGGRFRPILGDDSEGEAVQARVGRAAAPPGKLDASKPDLIAVLVDGKRIEAPLADVVEAQLVFELLPQPKKKAGPRKSQSAKR